MRPRVSCSQEGRSRCTGETGVRFFVIGGRAGCIVGWMVLGVGAGIGFGFGGVARGGGVAGFEEPGSFVVVAAFWSFASRFNRIYENL